MFEHEDIDPSKFYIATMRGIKRSAGKKRGRILGHRMGVNGDTILSYPQARRLIYIPTYEFVLRNRLSSEIAQLLTLLNKQDVVLLDYETNDDIDDFSRPLSHAALIRGFISHKHREE